MGIRMYHFYQKTACSFFLLLCSCLPAFAHGISDSDKQSMIEGGYLEYIRLGASHMLTGYDHLLFLFGVIFFLTQFKDVVKFITAFTLGHCITLIFATFMEITANDYLVDAVIALTVIYKGFDNLDGFKKFLHMESPNLVMLVFGFGLIHGFGLSTRLQQLPLGDDGLLLKILSFNVGVEIGQVIALSVMLFALSAWRKTQSFQRFSTASNFGLVCAGGFLFMMQMHDYSHQVNKTEAMNSMIVMPEPTDSDWQDTIDIRIPAGKGLEYKFYMQTGDSIEYVWETNGGELYFDLHGEVKVASGEYKLDDETSYKEGTHNTDRGEVVVPFEGSHGWWWKNNGTEEVIVSVKTNGEYKLIGVL